jgi:hypothetical protein
MLDKFVTPIRCALSALQEKGDAFSIPSEQERKNAQKDFSEDSRLEVLQITSVLSVAKLEELVEAGRERCVDSGEDGEKALKNVEFMTNVHAVISTLNWAGLGADEEPDWAGSAFAAAFPSSSGKPVPDLVVPYLEANGECVFGDCWGQPDSRA